MKAEIPPLKPVAATSAEISRNLNPHVTRKIRQKQRYGRRVTEAQSIARRLPSPIVASKLLDGSELSFLDFLFDKECESYLTQLFGGDSAAGTMIREFRKAHQFHYYGHRRTHPCRPAPKNPGLLDDAKSSTRRHLKDFAWRAYRGDPEGRDRVYWKRVAGLVWYAYETLMALRARSANIKQKENERIAQLAHKRAQSRVRVRRYRERSKAKQVPQANKPEAEQTKE